jgi:hypothetical protein
MDQVRAFLGWIKAQHFWVLTLLIVVLSTAGWYLASGALAAKFKANQAKIAAEFTSQQALQSKPFKANEPINVGQEQQIKLLAEGVRKVWNQLYDRQKEDVLKWPEALGPAFLAYVNDGKRFGDKIRDDHRERYLNYIQNQFPNLLKIIDARELPFDGSTGGGGIGGAMPGIGGRGPGIGGGMPGIAMPAVGAGLEGDGVEEKHRTEWVDQTDLRSRMNLAARPDSIEIWVLQEDLWVYESILRAIAQTNKATGASRRSRMAVRTIYELQVGRNAAAAAAATGSRLIAPSKGNLASGEGMMGMGEDMMAGGELGGGGMDMSGGAMGESMGGGLEGEGVDLATLLLAGRYLDPEGAPIMEAGEGASFGVEYKRLPVRMTLEMDIRWLTRLIAELGNASLQVEVQQVRINPTDNGGGMGGGPSTPRVPMGGGSGETQAFDRDPSIGTVVLQGVVTIFNEPDESVLNVGDEADESVAGL